MLALRRGLTGLATQTTARVMTSVRHASTFKAQDDHALEFREKPESLSYFTGNYKYNDLLIELDALYKQFARTAIGKKSDQMYSWKLRDKMSEALAIPLKTSQWRKIVAHLNSLTSLPHPLPAPILEAIEPYRRADLDQREHATRVKTLDDMGRALGVGRRKESSARCYVVEGDGQVLINGTPLHDYFKRPVDQAEVTLPLQVTENMDKYNIWALVEGGGNTGKVLLFISYPSPAHLIRSVKAKPKPSSSVLLAPCSFTMLSGNPPYVRLAVSPVIPESSNVRRRVSARPVQSTLGMSYASRHVQPLTLFVFQGQALNIILSYTTYTPNPTSLSFSSFLCHIASLLLCLNI